MLTTEILDDLESHANKLRGVSMMARIKMGDVEADILMKAAEAIEAIVEMALQENEK